MASQPSIERRPELLAHAEKLQRKHEARTTPEERKSRGQFFTPPNVASYMASLFSPFPKAVRVLDAGAGTGLLSAAIGERILGGGFPRSVEFVLYETDSTVVPLLTDTMRRCRTVLEAAGHRVTIKICTDDFVLSSPSHADQQSLLRGAEDGEPFDAIIMNPPYFKLAGDSEHARVMHRIVGGQPNMYAMFMALAAERLKPDGELVAITPRSFTNGLYFRRFRQWFLDRMSLRHAHLFESRRDTFGDADILQESIITAWRRSSQCPHLVTVSTSFDGELAETPDSIAVAYGAVVNPMAGDTIIRVPENMNDSRLIQCVEGWPRRFSDHGLRVSTGPVVMFRAREFLSNSPDEPETVPLLSVHNVRRFETRWPMPKNGKPVAFRVRPESQRLLLPARNYVLLRRFSAKEERRRLTASWLLDSESPHSSVALENHLNYLYHARRELTPEEVFGLAALFNSALLDRYFRIISGNTQVNATEIRSLPFPGLDAVARIGRRFRCLDTAVHGAAERCVLAECSIDGALEAYLMELAL